MRAAIGLALLVAVAAGSLEAQDQASERKGFWLTVGGGGGSNRVSCQECTEIERFSGGMGWIRAGGTVNSSTLIGGEAFFWQRSESGLDSYVRGVQGIVQWYPFGKAGFFFEGGLGLARIRTNFVTNGQTVNASETGISVTLGAGYDIRITRRLSLTPTIASIAVPTATIDTPAGPLDNVIGTIFQFGIGITLR